MSDEDLHRYTPITIEDNIPAPKGWKWALLTDVARLESGHTPSRRHPEWWGGDVPWIALPDIRALDGREAQDTAETINDLGLYNSSARLLPHGTVVMSRTASIGFVTVMGRPMATSQDFVNWVCSPAIEPWFLAHALIRSRVYLRSISAGAVHKTIYMPTLKGLRIALPPMVEQRYIIEYLSTGMAQQARVRAAAEQQLGLVIDFEDDFKETILLEASGSSFETTIGSLCAIDGPLVDPTSLNVRDLPCVSGEHIESGSGILQAVPSAAVQGVTSGKYHFQKGAVLYSKLRPYLRKVSLAPFAGLCSADMYPLRSNGRVDPEFLQAILLSRSFTRYAEDVSRRARMPKINQDQLFSYVHSLPDMREQRRVVERMRVARQATESARAAAAAQLAAINDLPGALLSAAFRGDL